MKLVVLQGFLGLVKTYVCRNLVENIYSQRVFEEYKRRWDAVTGKPWLQGLISDYFLRNVNSSNKMRSASQAASSNLRNPFCSVHFPN